MTPIVDIEVVLRVVCKLGNVYDTFYASIDLLFTPRVTMVCRKLNIFGF